MNARHSGRRRQYDPATEVQMLLRAAEVVMKRDDLRDVRLNEILAEAGLATRAFYRHFDSKVDLVAAVQRRDSERAAVRIRKHMTAATLPWNAVEAWVRELVGLACDPRKARRIVMVDASPASRIGPGPAHDYCVAVMTAPLLEALERGHAQGSLQGTSPEPDAATIYAICVETIRRCRDGRSAFTAGEACEYVLRFCRAALRPVTGPQDMILSGASGSLQRRIQASD